MIRTTLFSVALFTAAIAAVACTNSSDSNEESSEDELRASSACQNKTCGDACSVCAGRPNCIETAVLKFCSADGRCRPEQPVCAAECPTLSPPAPSFCPNGTIKPREQNGCIVGYDCVPECPTLSPPAPSFCPNGTIKPREQNGCIVGYDCVPRYNPCLATLCVEGTTCKVKPDGRPTCVPSYAPCAGEACGASCKVCPPSDPNCIETAVVKFCQKDGTCSGQTPSCN